jgi:hypothetical protein
MASTHAKRSKRHEQFGVADLGQIGPTCDFCTRIIATSMCPQNKAISRGAYQIEETEMSYHHK